MIKGKGISMRTAALIAGLPVFLPNAPYGEFYVFGKLINYHDAAQTTQNLIHHPSLFLFGILAVFFNFVIWDIVLAWVVYIFLRPANPHLSLLVAWFRLIFAVLGIVALFNFLFALHVANLPGIDESYRQQQVLQLVNQRRFAMNIAYLFFGVFLILEGILICKASYIPKVIGVLILLAGPAWMIIGLQPYFFKGYNLSWVMFFAIGELVFGIWLLIKGTRINETELIALESKQNQ